MPRCADCHHVRDERDADDINAGDAPNYRCAYRVPFWVPLPVHDYGSWVSAESGEKCSAFQPKK